MEEKRNDFLKMKKEMAEIEVIEIKIKEDLAKLMNQRQTCTEKCDSLKAKVRAIRLQFSRNV